MARYVVTFEAGKLLTPQEGLVALRRVIKLAGRYHGLRCLSYTEEAVTSVIDPDLAQPIDPNLKEE